MKRLRQKAKQTLCTLLVPLTLGVALPQKANAQETSKPLEAKVEVMSKHDDNGDLANKKLRTTLSYDKFMFRLDKNWDRRSQYAFDFKAIDKEKTKLALSTGGDLEDNGDKYAHEFSATLTQYMGRLPILGETTAKIHLLSSFRKDDNSFQKYRANLIGEHFDLAYQLRVEREEVDGKREKDPQYYLAFHNKDVWISLGKKRDNKIQGVFTTIGRPNFSLMTFGNYDFDSKVLSLGSWNAFKNGDPNIYNEDIGRLTANLLNIGTREILFPYFASYLTQGDITHKLDLKAGNGKFKMMNQVGMKITPNLGVGAGLLMKKHKDSKLQLSPVIESYARIPLGKNLDIFLEGSYLDNKVSGYAYIQFRK